MKKLLLLSLLIISTLCTKAQTPVQVIWCDGNDKITLKTAKTDGVKLKDVLSIEVSFPLQEIAKISQTVDFEVKWYYYMSTKKTLMGTNRITLNTDNVSPDGFLMLKSERKNTRQGWWEVQIRCKNSDSQVVFAGEKEYQVLLK